MTLVKRKRERWLELIVGGFIRTFYEEIPNDIMNFCVVFYFTFDAWNLEISDTKLEIDVDQGIVTSSIFHDNWCNVYGTVIVKKGDI